MDVFKVIKQAIKKSDCEIFHLHQGKMYENPKPRLHFGTQENVLIEPEVHSEIGGELKLLEQLSRAFLNSQDSFSKIALCNGATNGLWLTFSTLTKHVSPNITVLSPYWMHLPGVIQNSGGSMCEVSTISGDRLKSEEEILYDLRKNHEYASTIYLANPANPFGNIFSREFIQSVIKLCEATASYLVVDHAYYGFSEAETPDGEIRPLDEIYLHEKVFNVFTFSKLFGVPGLRLGFVFSNSKFVKEIINLYSYSNYSLNSYSQLVVYDYLLNKSLLSGRQIKYKENLDIYKKHMEGLSPIPEGGFFSFIPLPMNCTLEDFFKNGIGIVDGSIFGKNLHSWARICFTAEPPEKLIRALTTIKKLMENKLCL